MGDDRLRALERAAGRGDAVARAAWLREQVRVGAMDERRLRLLAYCDDAAAALAAGRPQPARDVTAWVLGLEAWGAEACVRAALAATSVALPLWEARSTDPRPGQAVLAVRTWLAAPQPARALDCRARAEELWADLPHGTEAWSASCSWFVVAAAAWTPAAWTPSGPLTAARLTAEAAARCASLAVGGHLPYDVAPGSVRPCATPAALRATLTAALRAWALDERAALAA